MAKEIKIQEILERISKDEKLRTMIAKTRLSLRAVGLGNATDIVNEFCKNLPPEEKKEKIIEIALAVEQFIIDEMSKPLPFDVDPRFKH